MEGVRGLEETIRQVHPNNSILSFRDADFIFDLGPLVYLTVGGQGIFVLNSHQVAADLLDRRGNNYSDRPRMISEFPSCPTRYHSKSPSTALASGKRDTLRWFLDDFGKVQRSVGAFPSIRSSWMSYDHFSWRRMRRASHEALNKSRVTEFYPLHVKEAVVLIDGMLQNPSGWEGEFRR